MTNILNVSPVLLRWPIEETDLINSLKLTISVIFDKMLRFIDILVER